MCTRRQIEDFTSESGHALLDLPSQHGHHGEEQSVSPSPRPRSPNDSFRDPTLRDEPSEAPFPAYPEKDSVNAPFTRRLGQYLLFCNIGALILLLGSISVLSFLWFGNDGNSHWATVMIDGWVGQAVTLSTLAIRLAFTTQASTAVAMLAAIQLEAKRVRGVLLADAPAISVARHGNTGPLTSILTFWNDASWMKCGTTLPVMAVLALCTLISQFTSTLLLWDVRGGVVRGFPHNSLRAVGMGMEGYIRQSARMSMGDNDYWTSSPRLFPTFAEHNAKPRVQTVSIADTGPTVRAILPISSESDRYMIRRFEGRAAVFDARVSCVRPNLTDLKLADTPGSSGVYFEGYAKPSQLTEELRELLRPNQSDSGLFFQCRFDDFHFVTDPMFKICSFNKTDGGGLINSLDPMFNGSIGYSFGKDLVFRNTMSPTQVWLAVSDDRHQAWPIELGHTFLIIRAKSNSTSRSLEAKYLELLTFATHDRGVWVDFTSNVFTTNSESAYAISTEFSVTMCYDAWYNGVGAARIKHLQEMPITASRSTNTSEPLLAWDPQRKSYDTAAIRSQLAARAESNIDRAILELDVRNLKQYRQAWSENWSRNRCFTFFDENALNFWFPNTTVNSSASLCDSLDDEDNLNGLFKTTPNETFDFINEIMWKSFDTGSAVTRFEISALCGNCSSHPQGLPHVSYKALHPTLNAIFRDTLIETDNPALAWQALTTTVAQTAYYEWLPTFDSYAPITTTSMVPCQVPRHYTGFTIVAVNLIVHLGLLIVITIWFYKATKTSLLNNAWQAVAQLKSTETEELFHRATTATDAEVKKWIKEGQEPRRRFRIVRDGQSNRVHLS